METLETINVSQSILMSIYLGLKEVFSKQVSYESTDSNINTLVNSIESVDFWEKL